jgi:hypothetical protein
MTAEQLAQVIGKAIYEQGKEQGAFVTEPHQAFATEDGTEDFDKPLAGTLTMAFDGSIDLMELAKTILETKETS